MDSRTTVDDLKRTVHAFAKERDWEQFHIPKDLALHLVVEAAELLDHFRYKTAEDVNRMLDSPKRDEVEMELADVAILLVDLARAMDVDVSEAVAKKMAKNAIRYPVEKSKGVKKKYDEL